MQTRYFGIASGEGFSSVLSNSNIPISSLVIKIQDNLDVLPAGPKPPDPAKLLNSNRCAEVVNELRAMTDYDIILFDTPPCSMLSDPILLGEKLDGILFLIGLGKGSRILAPQASRRIKATGVDLLGVICNQVNFPSRLNDYGYEYGYYYHYAYAYTDSYANKNAGIGRYINAEVNSSEKDKEDSSDSSKSISLDQPKSTLIKKSKKSEKNTWISKIFRR
jgi:Mrp family chromosome partitioning ATPase